MPNILKRYGKKRTCTSLTADTGSILVRWTFNEKEDMRWLYNDSQIPNVPKKFLGVIAEVDDVALFVDFHAGILARRHFDPTQQLSDVFITLSF